VSLGLARWGVRLAAAAVLAGCSGPAAPVSRVLPATTKGPFIALEREFRDLRGWERFELAERPAQGVTHTRGKRRIYLNARPATGSGSFPVGTILVKELMGSDVHPDHKFFAMVKRGGGYNARGAHGWEWFELRERDGRFTIAWRGLDAPSGEGYGGGMPGEAADPLGGCNSCHGIATDNDFVRADALELPRLVRPPC
jgi:hypothetical protein